MERPAFTQHEQIGLAVAAALHLALVGLFLLQPTKAPTIPPEQRMTVNLAQEVGLTAASPDPVSESAAAIAPTLSPIPAPAIQPPAQPVNEPPRATPSRSQPSSTARAQPSRQPARTAPRQRTRERAPDRTERRRPDAPASTNSSAVERGGGSRVGDDFLGGAGSSTQTTETRIPASQIGRSAKASLIQAISRQIKPHWSAPSGAEADLLVTILAFELNADGSLKGRPRILSQSGETPANAAQKDLHGERAIRAVQLAAPFDLPPEYYNAWKSIRGARFDRNLSR